MAFILLNVITVYALLYIIQVYNTSYYICHARLYDICSTVIYSYVWDIL